MNTTTLSSVLLPSTANAGTPRPSDAVSLLDSSVKMYSDALNETIIANSTTESPNAMLQVFNLFEDYPWLMWVVIGFVLLAVVGVVVVIFMCIVINKKRVIRRGSSEAIFEYDDSERFLLLGCIPCCCKRYKSGAATQPSLESYRKTPLPPIGGGKLEQSGSATAPEATRSPRSRLEPLAPVLLHKSAEAHAAYLRNVPVIPIAEKDYRPLPILNRQPAFPQ